MKLFKIFQPKSFKYKLFINKPTLISKTTKFRKKINIKKNFQILRKFFNSYNFLFLKNKIDEMKELFIFSKFLVLKWDFLENKIKLKEESLFLILNGKIFNKKIFKLNMEKKKIL